MSAHSIRSPESGVSASLLVPAEVLGTDLFFALDDELEVDRQPGAGLQQRFGGLDVREDLALVVRRAAPVQVIAAHFGLERVGLPQAERIDGLHIIVAIHQHRRASRACAQPLGQQALSGQKLFPANGIRLQKKK